jgi:hypothetical protein
VLAGEHARHHLTLRARSEPASTVCHVRPSCRRPVVVATTSLRRRPDSPSQPSISSVGRSASPTDESEQCPTRDAGGESAAPLIAGASTGRELTPAQDEVQASGPRPPDARIRRATQA